MKQQEVGAVAFAQSDPFEVEAREAIQLGKRLGVSFGTHEPQILRQIVQLEVKEHGSRGKSPMDCFTGKLHRSV